MMASQHDKNTMSLTLELTGSLNGGKIKKPECRRLDTPDGLKLQVQMPQTVDLDCATASAGLLLDGIERMPTNVAVHRVEISNLRFTANGAGGVMMFLAIQAPTVKHLKLTNLMPNDGSEQDEQAFGSIALAFQDSVLESLDLSSNKIGPNIWNSFGNQTKLQTMLLEDVWMGDESLQALSEIFTRNVFAGCLAELSYSNKSPVSEVRHSNNILYKCNKLSTLKWINKDTSIGGRIPCLGVYDLAQKMFRQKGTLRHLEFEGAQLSDDEFDALCKALKLLYRLQVVKLRAMSISEERCKQVVTSVNQGHLPLKILDLSQNNLGDAGAESIAGLAENRMVMTNLRHLNIEHNEIGNKGGIALLTALGGVLQDINVNGNPMDMSKIALAIAAKVTPPEKEKVDDGPELDTSDDEKNNKEKGRLSENGGHDVGGESQNVGQLLAAQSMMKTEIQMLQQEVKNLTHERDTLVGAFTVMGAMKHVDERNLILERLAKLEDAVLGRKSSLTKTPKTRSRASVAGTNLVSDGNHPIKRHSPIRDPVQLSPPRGRYSPSQRSTKTASVDTTTLQNQKSLGRERFLSPIHSQPRRTYSHPNGNGRPDAAEGSGGDVPTGGGSKLPTISPMASPQEPEGSPSQMHRRTLSMLQKRRFSLASAKERVAPPTLARDVSGGPEVVLPDLSSDRADDKTGSEREKLVSRTSSGRFTAYLHDQLESQLYRRGSGQSQNESNSPQYLELSDGRKSPIRRGEGSQSLHEMDIYRNRRALKGAIKPTMKKPLSAHSLESRSRRKRRSIA